MKFVSTFSQRFTELLSGQTYRQAAEKLGISCATASYYSSGQRKPKQPALKHIAECYNVDPVWLLGGDVPKFRALQSQDEDPNAGLKAGIHALIDQLPAEKLILLSAYLEGLKGR